MKKIILVILTLLLLLGIGCVRSVRYSEEEIKYFPPDIQEHIRKGEVTLGMTQSQVRYSWGAPSSTRILEPSENENLREEWTYLGLMDIKTGLLFKTQVIFTDGVVSSFITNDPGIKIKK
jgi:uncharacterized protein YneF (UPF0154 family)